MSSVRGELAEVRRRRIIELLGLGTLSHRQIAERHADVIALHDTEGR